MKNVRISSISLSAGSPGGTPQEKLINGITQASLRKPDVIVLPEISAQLGYSGKNERLEKAETVPGPTFDMVANLAGEHDCYIFFPLFRKDDNGNIYNSTVIISPQKEAAGIYNKMFPTVGELDQGVVPGTEAPVFDLPFGRAGCAICFDLNFSEVRDMLYKGKAEIVFFSSMYEGGLSLQIWAYELGAYVVLAHAGGFSQFVDITGKVLQKGDKAYEQIVTRELNLDRTVLHLDENHKKIEAVIAKYGNGIAIETIRPEAVLTLESRMEDVTVEDICKEFGLETRREYFARARKKRQEMLGE